MLFELLIMTQVLGAVRVVTVCVKSVTDSVNHCRRPTGRKMYFPRPLGAILVHLFFFKRKTLARTHGSKRPFWHPISWSKPAQSSADSVHVHDVQQARERIRKGRNEKDGTFTRLSFGFDLFNKCLCLNKSAQMREHMTPAGIGAATNDKQRILLHHFASLTSTYM